RYDGVLYNTTTGPIFGLLISMFICKIGDTEYPLALVQPCDAPLGSSRPSAKDKALGFFPVRAKRRSDAEFISIHSIIRGAVLVPDFASEGYFLIHDLVDHDIFLRIKQLQK
ncbi:hypothetical protein K466DRAFT_507378, partial [Polyporus arcularius HHB13444]